MKENNRECFTEIGSLTEAMKMQDALAAAAIPSKLVKTDSSLRRGCVYSLSYSCAQENNVRTVLGGIKRGRRQQRRG